MQLMKLTSSVRCCTKELLSVSIDCKLCKQKSKLSSQSQADTMHLCLDFKQRSLVELARTVLSHLSSTCLPSCKLPHMTNATSPCCTKNTLIQTFADCENDSSSGLIKTCWILCMLHHSLAEADMTLKPIYMTVCVPNHSCTLVASMYLQLHLCCLAHLLQLENAVLLLCIAALQLLNLFLQLLLSMRCSCSVVVQLMLQLLDCLP